MRRCFGCGLEFPLYSRWAHPAGCKRWAWLAAARRRRRAFMRGRWR